METIVRGSRKPDLEIVCTDSKAEADWASVTTSDVRVIAFQNDVLVLDAPPNEVAVSGDGKSLTVRRVWGVGETETVGRMWIEVEVQFGTGYAQVFPTDGPLRLDIVPGAPGT